jgi:hypothetical protein
MLANAIRKGAREHAAIAKGELDHRFPGWDKVQSKRGGSKPTIATFQGRVEHFPTTKEAYVWLVERFANAKPELFSDPSKETVGVANGRNRNYFARSPENLFRETPELAENSSNFVRLSNGWYANVNLNNAQKFSILARLSWRKLPRQVDSSLLDSAMSFSRYFAGGRLPSESCGRISL